MKEQRQGGQSRPLQIASIPATARVLSMLSLHLGMVFALFLSMPYGKFVHGLYRAGALSLSNAAPA
jgi:hypothetical protein